MSIYTPEFCVYLTVYAGHKLPPFYIGSTLIKKINKGYRGSVRSIKYKTIWNEELKHNPHLFKTHIIKTHTDRKQCLADEYKFQQALNVVKSPMYINESFATINGYFGRLVKGNQHPLYGKPRSVDTKLKISQNHRDRANSNNTNAKHIVLITPAGEHIKSFGNFKKTCQDLGIGYSTMNKILKQGIYPIRGNCVGYDVYIDVSRS